MDFSVHQELIEKYQLKDKIILEDYKVPQQKFFRFLKAFILFIRNINHVEKLFSFVVSHRKLEIKNIYIFHFFSRLRRNFDIIHVQYGTNGKPLDLLKKINFFPPKLIVSFHGHDLFFPINGVIENNGYYDNLFAEADLLVANTQYLKDLLIELGAPETKLEIIPVAVDTDFFKKKYSSNRVQEKIKLITVGRLEFFKGQHLGISCIKILKERGYNIQYTLIGTGSRIQLLKQQVEDYDLNNEVILKGKMSQREIRDALQGKDIFLMTSITDPDYGVETQGLVTAEAQACGIPIVAFDSGGVKYTIENGTTGFVVPEGNIDAMVDKIETLLKDPELRMKMGEKALKFVEKKFSQNHLNTVWRKTYRSLC